MGSARRIAFVGLAKNTGKTLAMTVLLSELEERRQRLGVTSIGHDGEPTDSLNPLIRKPPVRCPAGTLVATTGTLMHRSGAVTETLVDTGLRTPLGTVSIFRLMTSAEVEIAGPSTASGVQEAAATMLNLGAERVIIDGSIDRRAAAAPTIAEAVVISTGAVLGTGSDEVSARTAGAVELGMLPVLRDRQLRDRLNVGDGRCLLVGPSGVTPFPTALPLTASTGDLLDIGLDTAPPSALYVPGSVPESFLTALLPLGAQGPLKVIAEDPTKVFLRERSPSWYTRQGVQLEVMTRAQLRAITVNPVAPLSHALDSTALCNSIRSSCPGLPVFDVAGPEYSSGH